VQATTQFPAIGTTVVVAVADRDQLDRARATVEETIAAFDQTCSRFRDDSELCSLNAAAGQRVKVSPLLFEALGAALRAAQLTDGDVDPTVGQALIALGYDRDFDDVVARPGTGRVRFAPVPGWRTMELDEVASTVRVPTGVTLDLGATAKALAADHAAAAAHSACECGVLVSLGGDIAFAGPAPADEGWRIRVTDDHRSDVTAPGQWITLGGGGLATSSVTTRSWRADGGSTVHHLIDPATGRSVASTWRTASVAASSCLDANIASTAAIVRGEAAVAWLTQHKLPSRLVDTDGHARHVAGWPEEGDDLT
jgi:thiamine biosynthesis lipoprotein